MSAKIKGMTGRVSRRRPGRPAGKGETGAIYADVDRNYLRLCEKYGWPVPGKWKAKIQADRQVCPTGKGMKT